MLVQQEAINKENQANIDRYHACIQNKTNEECEYILDNNDSSDPYNDCLMNRSTTWEECENILMGNKTVENMTRNIIRFVENVVK